MRKKLFKLYYRLRHFPRNLLLNTTPVVVYTIAKGASSVRVSLSRHNIGPVFWAHHMLSANIHAVRERHKKRNLKPFFRPFPPIFIKILS